MVVVQEVVRKGCAIGKRSCGRAVLAGIFSCSDTHL